MSEMVKEIEAPNQYKGFFKKIGYPIWGLFKGLFPTFLGVYLAFYLNDRWVFNQEQALIAQLKETLKIEILENLEQIQSQIPYHEMLYDSSNQIATKYLTEKDRSAIPYATYWQGIGASQLSDAAYLTAISTQNLAKMDLPLTLTISNAYATQKDYEGIVESARIALLAKNWPDYITWLNYMRWTASNLLSAEQKVVSSHEAVLKLLDENYQKNETNISQ